MVQHPIYESDAKNIIRQNVVIDGFQVPDHVIIDDTNFEKLPKSYPWLLESKLVVKPDQCVKGRGLSGLVGLNYSWNQVCNSLVQNFGKKHSVGTVKGILSRFIVEPFIKHEQMSEHYLCFRSEKNEDIIMYSEVGGVEIGDVCSHSKSFSVKVHENLSVGDIDNFFSCFSIFKNLPLLSELVFQLFGLFRRLHFTYLEFNPLIVFPDNSKIVVVDVAAKVDTCAEFLCSKVWRLTRYPETFGRQQSDSEKYIAELDSKSGSSLKFVLLNKDGRIWTMVAGGGASVVFTDTICDLGFSSELANYGEYSGAPTLDETFEYAKTIIQLMTSGPVRSGKVFIIGGGIANFTNVATTFKGIINAIREYGKKMLEHHVTIFVRRGGPNYEEGLKNIKDACDELKIPAYVFGINVHMTSIISMALGLKPVTCTMSLTTPDTVTFPSRSFDVGTHDAPLITSSMAKNHSPDISAKPSSSEVLGSPRTQVKLSRNLTTRSLFDKSTTAIVWGYQEVAIQGMLDFDYICGREVPSVCCMIYPFRASVIAKFYFGLNEILIPIYGSFHEATSNFPKSSVLINFASMRSSYEVSMEALEYPQFKVISVFAEGIPERQTQILNHQAYEKGVTVIGPASIGGIKPGSFRIAHAGGNITNVVASKLYRPGSVCYITRSGGLSNELNNILSKTTDGVLEGIHLGGDRYPGTSYMDHIRRFLWYPDIELIVLLGEVGGLEEYEVCRALKANEIHVPVVAWCIGTCASFFETNVQFGHANACADIDAETARAKNLALREAGALVPENFDHLYDLIKTVYTQRVAADMWCVKPEIDPPPIPVDYKFAREIGLIRKPTSFISTICDERGSEPTYSGHPISEILDQNLGIGAVIGLLWFQRLLPDYINQFFEICLIILADHGPAVAGAHNTIVTTRAGKDMISSLCSGLLSIGDRFGGAINGAANQFWNAYRSNKTPSEFVQEMRKKGELILGIGHLIKSVTNPDHRVQKLIEFVKKRQPTPLLDYALEVEKITTSKKSNLILNVDGTIAVSLIDMMLHSNYFSEDDVQNYIKIGAFNSIFILSRTIGFIGHYIDQKRLKQGLYRHPWDDILFMTGLDINKK